MTLPGALRRFFRRRMPRLLCFGRFLRYMSIMPCLIGDMVESSGVAPRTLREWVRRGMLRPPKGHGPAAEYPDENLVRAVAIARMRASGAGLDEIATRTKRWSVAKFEAFVAETDPKVDGVEEPAAAGDEPTAYEPSARLPPPGSDGAAASYKPVPMSDAQSLQGPRWVVRTLLPGLVFMVSDDAPPLVRRLASEIFERYGTTGR
jgi:DNA-binding transcriptional MerR regulator